MEETQIVHVPIPIRCDVPEIEKPELPFDEKAKKEMALFEKIKLLLAQNLALKGYTVELEAALKACSKPEDH